MLELLTVIMSLSFPIFFLDGLLFIYLKAMLWGLYTFNILCHFLILLVLGEFTTICFDHIYFLSQLLLDQPLFPSGPNVFSFFGFFFKPIKYNFCCPYTLGSVTCHWTDLPRTTLFNRTDSPSTYQLPIAF